MTPEQVEAVVARVMGDDMAFEQCDERMVPPDIRDRVTAAIREAVAAERGRCVGVIDRAAGRLREEAKAPPHDARLADQLLTQARAMEAAARYIQAGV